MDTKPREGAIVTVDVNRAIREMTVNVRGAGSTTLHLGRMHADNLDYAAFHGMEQRLRDAAAQSRDPITGLSAPAIDKLAAVARLVEHYESGSAEWTTRGQGSGGDVGILIAAIVAAGLKSDTPEFRANVRAKSKVERDALALIPAVKVELDRLNAARTVNVDVEALMAGI